MNILNRIKKIKDKLIFKVIIWILSVWFLGSFLISLIEPVSFKNIGSYKSTNLAVSENDKQDIEWESHSIDNELFN